MNQHQLYIECKSQSAGLELLERAKNSDGFAVVGTRYPSQVTLRWLKQELARLKNSSLILVSGMALGIDALAHETAIEVGIPTIAFLACGLDQTYPPEHTGLREKIISSGGVVATEYEPGNPALKYHFLKRNRLIAWYSRAVLIAESPEHSGALNTAKWAQEYERDLYTIPAFPNDPRYSGNLRLLEQAGTIPFTGIRSLGNTWLSFSSQNSVQMALFEESPPNLRAACEFIYKKYPHLPPPELMLEDFTRAGFDATLLFPAWNYLSLKSRTS